MRNKSKFEDQVTKLDACVKAIKVNIGRTPYYKNVENDILAAENIISRISDMLEMEDYSVGNSYS